MQAERVLTENIKEQIQQAMMLDGIYIYRHQIWEDLGIEEVEG